MIQAQKEGPGLNQGAVPGKTGTKAEPVLDTLTRIEERLDRLDCQCQF